MSTLLEISTAEVAKDLRGVTTIACLLHRRALPMQSARDTPGLQQLHSSLLRVEECQQNSFPQSVERFHSRPFIACGDSAPRLLHKRRQIAQVGNKVMLEIPAPQP